MKNNRNKALLSLGGCLLFGSIFSFLYFVKRLETEKSLLQILKDKNTKLENQFKNETEEITTITVPIKNGIQNRELEAVKGGKWFMGADEEERKSTLKELVNSRYKSAQKSDSEGKLKEALEEYLWCFDVGMIESPSHSRVRMSSLLKHLVGLGKRYPDALAALVERRNQFERAFLDGEENYDFIEMNNQLGEEVRNLAILDELPEEEKGGAKHHNLVKRIFDLLVEDGRYIDASTARPYPIMSMQCESEVESAKSGRWTIFQGSNKKDARTRFYQTALNIETLAAMNEIEQAADLIDRVLAYDSSLETVAVLESRLKRVARTDLLEAMIGIENDN